MTCTNDLYRNANIKKNGVSLGTHLPSFFFDVLSRVNLKGILSCKWGSTLLLVNPDRFMIPLKRSGEE
jgi:hypothetical protein